MPRRHRAPLGAVLGALGLAAATAACSAERAPAVAPPSTVAGPAPSSAPSTAAPVVVESVAMVGDSITVGSMDQLQLGFASLGLDDVEIDAESGRRMVLDGTMTSGLVAVRELAGDEPDLWVIALGTNDVANYAYEEYAPAIDALLAAVPPDAPLVWVDTYLERFPDESAAFNLVLRAALAERGRAAVVDWAGLAVEDGVLRDGIHPSGFGVEQFALRIVAAVGDWVG